MKKPILAAALVIATLPAASQGWQSPPSPAAYGYASNDADRGVFASTILEAASSLRTAARPPIPGPAPSHILKPGDRGPDVTWLANALSFHGYYMPPQPQEVLLNDPYAIGGRSHATSQGYQGLWEGDLVFDGNLEHLLRQYQSDSGMAVDGVAGPRVFESLTRNDAALASGLEEWASAIEGWRQQALSAGYAKFIVVNIPSYTLHAFDAKTGAQVLESRVVAGAAGSRTPRFTTNIVNLKFNPDWTPTASMRGKRYAPPGPRNPLGRVRFSTDNNIHIYLHDTNSHSLFARQERAMSLGCVRVQEWAPLAGWIAGRGQEWVDRMTPADSFRTQYIKVAPVPVVMAYSLVDIVEGSPSVYTDVYGMGSSAVGYSALMGGSGWTSDLPVIAP